MTFLWYQVGMPLNKYVNALYGAKGPMPYRRDTIFPTPATDLKFNFGDPWHVRTAKGELVATCKDSWCLGIWDERHGVEWPERTDFVGVSFKPGGAHAMLGTPLNDLRNCVVPLDAIWGRRAADIHQQLQIAASMSRRFALLEKVLLVRLLATWIPPGSSSMSWIESRSRTEAAGSQT